MKRIITAMTALAMLASGTETLVSSAETTDIQPVSSAICSSAVTVPKVNADGYSATSSAVRVKWKKVSGATGYRVYRYNTTTKKWESIKTIHNNSTFYYRDTNVKPYTQYKYRVKAYKKVNGINYWGTSCSTITATTKPATIKFKSFSASQTAIRLNWTPVKCDGYQIYQKQSDGSYTKIVTLRDSSANTYRVEGLNAETQYTFKIRAYGRGANNQLIYGNCTAKAKTTAGVVWTDVDKAYYHMACGYPTVEQCELIREDICNYIMDNYSDQKHIKVDTSAYRVFHCTDSLSFNPNTMKLEKDTSGSATQISDAHCDHSVDLAACWVNVIPKKNGYTISNYNAIQTLKKDIYDYLGYDALFNTYIGNAEYTEEEPLLFNIGIECVSDGQAYVTNDADYYDEEGKDPFHIPQYTLWFCNVIP